MAFLYRLGFPSGSVVKNLPANAGAAEDVGSISGSGRSPGRGHGNPLQYSCLENPMDRGTWRATVHGVAKSQTWLSDWACTWSFLWVGLLVATGKTSQVTWDLNCDKLHLNLGVRYSLYPEKAMAPHLQYSCLENPMDRGAWKASVHGVPEGWTRLSDFTFTFHFHTLEKEMVTHSSVLAWRIPGTGEPGGLPSMGSPRVGHDLSDLVAAAA